MATPNNQFRLRLYPNTYYNFIVHWGDGTSDVFNQTTPVYQSLAGLGPWTLTQQSTVSASWPGITHTYNNPNSYTVSITEMSPGGFPGLEYAGIDEYAWDAANEFNNDAKKIKKISQWGDVQWNPTNAMSKSFEGCINLNEVVTDGGTSNLGNLNNFLAAWYNCTSLTSFPILDTSNGSNFNYAWGNCSNLNTFPVIDTSNGSNFSYAWDNCSNLKTFPAIDTSKGTQFLRAWFNNNKLITFPQLNMSKANDIRYAWSSCSSLTSFPLIEFSGGPYVGTYNAGADGEDVWRSCSSLKNFPNIRSLSGIKYFVRTWMGCTGLTGFQYNNFLNTIFLENTWYGCTGFTQFPYISCDNVQGFQGAWQGCSNLTNFPNISTLSGTDFSQTWTNCYNLSSFPLLNFSNAKRLYATWQDCLSLSSFPMIDTSNVNNFSYAWRAIAYNRISNLTTFPKLNTSKGQYFIGTWENCGTLKNFPEIDTLSGIDFSYAWNGCIGLTAFPLLSTNNGIKFDYAWFGCTSLSTFPLFDTPKAETFNWSFGNTKIKKCPEFLTYQNNVKNVTSFKGSWSYNSELTDTTDFYKPINNSKVQNIAGAWMFCDNIVDMPSNMVLSGVTIFGQSSQAEYMIDSPINNSNQDWPIRGAGAWAQCHSLSSFPLLDTRSGTDFSVAWYNCFNLKSFPKINIGNGKKFVRTWSRCNGLSSFPSLDFRSAYQINGAWAFCNNLSSVEYIELSGCRYFGGAWSGLDKIKTFPQINTLSATSFYDYWRGGGAWQNCTSLTAFPMIDTSNCTNFKSAWENCYSLSASPFPQLDMSKMRADSGSDSFNRLYEADDGGQCGFGGRDCFKGVKLQTQSYSALLTSLCATNFNSNVQFHGGLSNFNQAGKDARDYLVSTRGWTIGGTGVLEI